MKAWGVSGWIVAAFLAGLSAVFFILYRQTDAEFDSSIQEYGRLLDRVEEQSAQNDSLRQTINALSDQLNLIDRRIAEIRERAERARSGELQTPDSPPRPDDAPGRETLDPAP